MIFLQVESKFKSVVHPARHPPMFWSKCQLSRLSHDEVAVSAESNVMDVVDVNPTLLPGTKYQ
jgi:hypothetical protein